MPSTQTQMFDLNIEEVLENWDVHHGVREIIANALDEQVLSGTDEVQIEKDGDEWVVRDFGRGLDIRHFTLNENPEKLQSSEVIGKFGVGLKDALATFHRHGVRILIRAPRGTFNIAPASKHGFEDIQTLHVEVSEGSARLQGTEVRLGNVADKDIERAKRLFLRFAQERVLDQTKYGQVLERKGQHGRIYIMGVLANEEPNFLFSYNITSLTPAMKKRLNRERVNVGRTTYADRVKAILREVTAELILDALADQVRQRSRGEQADEMSWAEVSQLALNHLAASSKVVYVTESELGTNPGIVGHMRADGYEVQVVPDVQKARLQLQERQGGPAAPVFEAYLQEWNDSFEYSYVEPESLSPAEAEVWGYTNDIVKLAGVSKPPPIRVSETLRLDLNDTTGVWDPQTGQIVILRTQLASISEYAGTLLHELAHFTTGAPDASVAFESELTRLLGRVAKAHLAG